jgi:hypothetical protein
LSHPSGMRVQLISKTRTPQASSGIENTESAGTAEP